MKKFIYILILILLSTLVYAAPPLTLTSTSDSGLELKVPIFNNLVYGDFHQFEIHVYNKSNGMPINSNIGCYFHLYGMYGEHILELYDDTPSHDFDYSFKVYPENFSLMPIGEGYNYLVQCNNSNKGGFFESDLKVSVDGKDEENKQLPLIIGIALISSLLIFFCFKLENDHFLLKLLCMFFSLYGLILIPQVFTASINTVAVSLIKVTSGFFKLFITYFAFYIVYWQFDKIKAFLKKVFGSRI